MGYADLVGRAVITADTLLAEAFRRQISSWMQSATVRPSRNGGLGSIRHASTEWMRRDYGFWLDEHGYRGIPRGLLIEPFVGDRGVLPIDYKLYVFHGRVSFIQVHLGREDDHRWLVFDRDWRRVSSLTADSDPPPPASLARMIRGAEVLGRGFDFVRIDFYEVGNRPRFGEMTFYPGSGLDPFDPPELDLTMGALWLGGCTARDHS